MSQVQNTRTAVKTLLVSILLMLPFQLSAQAPWTVNEADFENNGSIEAIVALDGTEVTSGYLGAFVGDECRGVEEGAFFPVTGKYIFSLMCHSNVTSGELLTFKYYDPDTDTEYQVQETIEFIANMQGDAKNPDILNAFSNSAPVANCPDQSTLDPVSGPVTFNLCDIFSDPDGDALTYDATGSDGATLNWINGCELEFTAAAIGTTTLTLSATDGDLSAECNYSFTVNKAPIVDRSVGMRVLEEGFGTLQVNLDTIFSDPEGDALTYTATSQDAAVVSAAVSGSLLTISEVAPGNTTVTMEASDGESSTQDIATIVIVASGPALPWNVATADYQYTGQIDAVVRVNDVEVNTGILAAFVGDQCRGIVEGSYFAPNGKTIFSLLAYSNSGSGDILTFRYYDPENEVIQTIDEVIPFSSDMKLGSATVPVELNISSANNLPRVDNPIADQVQDEHFGTLQVETGAVFSDPDGDPLSYSVSIDDESVATVGLEGTTLMITEAGTGTTVVELYASDGEFSTLNRFTLTVNEVNDSPVVENTIPDQSLLEDFGSKRISISGIFSDPEGDVLSYSSTSDDETVVTVTIEGGELVITEAGFGTATVSVCVRDAEYQVCVSFSVTVEEVNESPVVANPLEDQVLQEGFASERITVSGVFSDPDGDVLSYSSTSDDEAVVTVAVEDDELVISETGIGTATVSLCATDGEFKVCVQFSVTVEDVNESPVVAVPLEDQTLQEGFGSTSISVAGTFTDPDEDVLSYAVSSGNEDVATVSVDGTDLVITEAGTGTVTIIVCASDGELEVCDQFNVLVQTVNQPPEAICPSSTDVLLVEGFGSYGPVNFCEAFSDPDDDALTYTVTTDDPSVATALIDGCDITVNEVGVGTAFISVCASDGEFEICCTFTVEIVAENELSVYLGADQLTEGDSIQHCSDTISFSLVVNSSIPWIVVKSGNWFNVEKRGETGVEIFFTENTTGIERSGTLTVRDEQDHVINLVVYQSETCGPSGLQEARSPWFSVWPNPVEDLVRIQINAQLSAGENVHIELWTADGRLLKEIADQKPGIFSVEMDVSGYPSGVYYMQVHAVGKRRSVIPLIKY